MTSEELPKMNEIEFIDDKTQFIQMRGTFTTVLCDMKSFEEAVTWLRKHKPQENPNKCYKYGVNYYFTLST